MSRNYTDPNYSYERAESTYTDQELLSVDCSQYPEVCAATVHDAVPTAPDCGYGFHIEE